MSDWSDLSQMYPKYVIVSKNLENSHYYISTVSRFFINNRLSTYTFSKHIWQIPFHPIWIAHHFHSFEIQLQSIAYDWLITNSSDNFTNLFHEFFPRIFLSLSSWKRKQTSHWFKISVFSQFASWKRYYNKYSLKNFVDSEFEIGESIWWTTPKLVMSFHLWKMGSGPCLITIPFKLAPMITSESLSSLKAS